MADQVQVKLPAGIILVAHEVLAPIAQQDMLAALPQAYQGLAREVVHLRAVNTRLSDLASLDWSTARRQQTDEALDRLLPLVQEHPDWRVQYFGAAPIPLAADLGYLIGGWTAVDVYQQRHDTNTWAWVRQSRSESAKMAELRLPEGSISADGQVVIRLSISHRIDSTETRAVIPHSLGEIDLALEVPNEDALQSAEDLQAIKGEFDKVVDWAHEMRPNADLHVFAAVPVGVALRLGMAINPTIHSPVHTYQYSRNSSPRYQHALTLQRAHQSVQALTPEESAEAAVLRKQIGEELDSIRAIARQLADGNKVNPAENWLKLIVPKARPEHIYGPSLDLAKLFETPLLDSAVDQLTTQVADAFEYDRPSRMWRLDDRFLTALAKRFMDEASRRQAGRLLLLHESVHEGSHGLTGATAREARRFPKVIEEVDYQADSWASVHDYALQAFGKNTSDAEARTFFINAVSTAIDTFWAFDAASDPRYMEIRRMNRYLIWYWQLLRLEHCWDLMSALKVLANRPVIEIAGPKVETRENRVLYSLNPAQFDRPELGLFFKNRIVRYGDGPASSVRDILIGFRDRDQLKIREALKSISDQIPN